ncbi:MAG TPA: cytochrome c oxidase subunit II [Terriglobales bacterium]|jgi:cytochrome c oxidase subunit 2|nr:cytochrome c oxidase subunit II [Terriglobales bacterium]
MVSNIPLFPESASSMSSHVDYLYFFLTANLIFFTGLVAVLVVYFAIRYRRAKNPKAEPIHGSMILELTWTIIPLGISLVMFAWGAVVYFHFNRPPANAMEIYGTGKQWMWKFQHIEGAREINQLHVPVNRDVRVVLTSQDVIHDFAVPAFRLKGDVVPGRYVSVWFRATKTGNYRLFCDQYCGTLHSGMVGEVIVMDPAEYQDWVSSRGEGSLGQQGEKIFQQLGCNTCHRNDSLARGPNLAGLYGNPVKLKDGSLIIADEGYIRESIVNPSTKIVAGFDNVMPTFQGQINEDDMIALVYYIKSLHNQQPGGPVKTSPNSTEVPGANPPVKLQ